MDRVDGTQLCQNKRFRVPIKYIPKIRSKLSETIHIIVFISLIIVSIVISESSGLTQIIVANLAFPALLVGGVEIVSRICYAIEECHHITTRYDNKLNRYFTDMLTLPCSLICCIVLGSLFSIVNLLIHNDYPWVTWYRSGVASSILSLCAILLLRNVLKLDCGPVYDSLWIANSNGLDYGSGMAHSFFHGYLKLVLPRTGTQEKNLEELMRIYESTEHIKMEMYKLFILLPKSLHCPSSLQDGRFPSILESKSLLEKHITVAGVKDRVYKNSVYKITTKTGDRIYVAAEYATPLKTFKDVVLHHGAHSNYYRKYRDEIVLQFYLTLNKLLREHTDCTPFCELIYYDDVDDNGDFFDVGRIIQARIRDIKDRIKKTNRGRSQQE